MGEVEERLVLNFIDEDEIKSDSNDSTDENHNPQIRNGKKNSRISENDFVTKQLEVRIKREIDCMEISNSEDNSLQPRENSQDIVVKYEPIDEVYEELKTEPPYVVENSGTKKRKRQSNKSQVSKTAKKVKPLKGQVKRITDYFKSGDINTESRTAENAGIDSNPILSSEPEKPIYSCKKCLYIGNSKANLERHTLLHLDPAEIKWYYCTECSYRTKYEGQLKSHFLVHMKPEEIEFFQCPHCDLKCSRKHNLTHHIKSIHSDRDYSLQCAECNYKTFSKDRLVAHMKMHSKAVFSCHLCKFMTKQQKYLDSHIKLVHTEVEKPFPCDTCSYKGKTKKELEKHHDRMHNKEKLNVYQCHHCKFNSIYKKNLEFHLLHMHNNSEGYSKFICGHCNKSFTYKNGLKTHIIRCHINLAEEDWHKCLECKYKTKDLNTLKRHIKRNHGAPRLHCKNCSFATNRLISMEAHKKTHKNKGNIFKCPECPHRSIQITSFLYHLRVVHSMTITSKQANLKYCLKEKGKKCTFE